jgi:hypothetical protein
MRYVFVLAFVVSFVGLSLVTDGSARGHRIVTGTVTHWRSDGFITIARQPPDPGFEISLHPNTVYDGDMHGLKSGARVTVWYRNVAERRLVADRVRMLDAGAP